MLKNSFLPGTEFPNPQPPAPHLGGAVSPPSWQWNRKQQGSDHLWAKAVENQVCLFHIPCLSASLEAKVSRAEPQVGRNLDP